MFFGWGTFFDFVSSSTRTMHPHGACVQMSGRNRIDPHRGRIERHTTRNVTLAGVGEDDLDAARDDEAPLLEEVEQLGPQVPGNER